jgi:tetratricopeptide (TPR) repeat protein
MATPCAGGGPPRVADFDELVDEVLARKGPAKYKDGLSEDNWEEELEQIPLFMTKAPEDVDPESAPAVAALQDLIYQEDTPHSRAMAYKEDGNEHFGKKRYKRAIEAYSRGLGQQCSDQALVAILHCNRATSHYHLGNFRSALTDASHAHKSDPGYMKAVIRAAECCVRLGRYSEAVQWCDTGLRREEKQGRLRELRARAVAEGKRQERDRRKEEAAAKAKSSQELHLINTIKVTSKNTV